ncbi:hypothetical protein [Hydrogenophaga sp.]|jgi:hypothetical protein|uniref:hypothetical protein n=1 Tax=Hydrogenophaga sp. TaxID=1904254 RepID=UPI003F728DE3
MKKNAKPFPWLPLVLSLLVLGASAVWGWNWYQKRYPSWYEEVRLSDGRVITIHQKREYYENYGTAQSWITIELPELGGKQVWHSYLMPQRVDVVNGKVYVFGIPRGDVQYSFYSDPKNYIVAFSWDGSSFRRIPFLSVPEASRQEENVYRCLPEGRITIDIARKDSQWCEPIGDEQQFTKRIELSEYQEASKIFARRGGRTPSSD